MMDGGPAVRRGGGVVAGWRTPAANCGAGPGRGDRGGLGSPRNLLRRSSMSIKLGIVAQLEAKPGKEEVLAELLRSAQALAAQEPGTVVWYAFRAGPRSFGIFDAFADETGREAHMQGRIAHGLVG